MFICIGDLTMTGLTTHITYPFIWFVEVFLAKITNKSANVLFPIHRFWPSRIQPPSTWYLQSKKKLYCWTFKQLSTVKYVSLERQISQKELNGKQQSLNLSCCGLQSTCITSIVRFSQGLIKKQSLWEVVTSEKLHKSSKSKENN